MPKRINLDNDTPTRTTMDADWSSKKKGIVASVCVTAAVGVLGAGIWYMISSAPPRLPRSANEAITVLASNKLENLDESRKREFIEEAARLVNTLPPEERRSLFEDEKNRDAMRALREAQFDEAARKFARGESMQDIWASMRPQRPEGERPEGERPEPRPERRQMTEEEREQAMKDRREQMNQRMADQFNGGNAQNMGLRMEMFSRMSAMGGGRWGGGGGRGGRPGGGGGGRGGN